MGTFYVGCQIENHINREKKAKIPKLPLIQVVNLLG